MKRDRWLEATESHLEELRQRRRGVVDDANAYKAEAELRLQAYKDELDAVKAEISAVENALESHRVRVGIAQLAEPTTIRALPAPRREGGANADDVVATIKAWVREHDGVLATGDLSDHLVAQGRYRQRTSAFTAISAALARIGEGFVKERLGLYRFHAIDGRPLHPVEEAELAAPA